MHEVTDQTVKAIAAISSIHSATCDMVMALRKVTQPRFFGRRMGQVGVEINAVIAGKDFVCRYKSAAGPRHSFNPVYIKWSFRKVGSVILSALQHEQVAVLIHNRAAQS